MNDLTDRELVDLGFERREQPVAYNKSTREFRYQCSRCLTWHRKIVFAGAKPICENCEALRQAGARHSLYRGCSWH